MRKNIRSRRKNLGVTLIFLIGLPFGSGFRLEANVLIAVTTVDIKRVPPNIRLIEVVPSISVLSLLELAAKEAKRSGAPLPKANSVTPAKLSGILKRIVIKASDGDK